MITLFEPQARRKRSLTMVPVINIIFILIFFFLVAGHLQKVTVLDVDLPKATSGKLLDEGPVELVLGKYGEMLINEALFSEEKARAELKRQLAANPERIVTIKADANTEANRLIRMMQMIQSLGGRNISIITQRVDADHA